MRIEQVEIRNFRTIYNAKIDFTNITTFIGPNGVGKSTVLFALDWFFNGKGDDLTDEDATYGHTSEPIEVRVTFSQLNDNDRKALGKYAPSGTSTFSAWKVRKDNREFLSANIKGNAKFTGVKQTSKAADKKELYNKLRDENPELGLPQARTVKEIDDALTAWEQNNPEALVDISEEVSTSFNGFNGNAAMRDIFNFTLVKADYRASDESEDSRNTLLSSIIERAVNRKAADGRVAELFSEIREREQRIYEDVFGDELKQLSTDLNDIVDSYSTARKISIEPSAQELKPTRTTFKVSVFDGDNETSVNRQGHGFQRTLLISALQLLAKRIELGDDISSDNHNGTICLAIEEPELYQHPIQARAFARVLRRLGEDANSDMQVLYATHSPYFIDPLHCEEIYRMSRSVDNGIPSVSFAHGSRDSVNQKLSAAGSDGVSSYRMGMSLSDELSAAIFANAVLLIEGSTEEAVVSSIADKLYSSAILERSGIAIVRRGGKDNIPYLHALLSEFHIPVVAVFDNDINKNTTQKKLNSNLRLIKYFKLADMFADPCRPDGGKYELDNGDFLFIVENTLEPYLEKNWKEFDAAFAKLCSLHNVQKNSKESIYYSEAIDNIDINSCPVFLRSIVDCVIGRSQLTKG